MKKILHKLLLVVPASIFLLYVFTSVEVQSSSFQPPTGRSQDPVNNSSCTASGCHDTWSPFTVERAIITIGTNAQNQQPLSGFQFTPGTQYLINFSVIGTASRYGFQMTALRGNAMAGSFSLINTNTTSLLSQNGISYVGHRSASGSVNSWSFNWTAPNTGTGNITFYTAVNKAYAPSGDSNDSIFHRTYTIIQAVVQPPIVALGNDTAICNGASVQLNAVVSNAQGNVSYSWFPTSGLSCTNCANPVATPSSTTSYVVTVNAGNGEAKDTINLTVNPLPVASISGNNQICSGSSTTLTATGGTTYNWNQGLGTGPSKTVSPTATTTYTVTVTNNFNCASTATRTVEVRNPSSEILFRSICQGGSFFFKGQNLSQAGTYRDTLLNVAGCDSFVTLNLTINSVVRDTVNRSICQGESVSFKGSQIFTAGVYSDTATALGGCDSITILVLQVNNKPVADAGSNKSITVNCATNVQLGGSPTASGGSVPYTYLWTPATALNNNTVPNPLVSNLQSTTTYNVLVTDGNNCTASAQTTVEAVQVSVSILQSGNVLASSGSFPAYRWLLNGNFVNNATDSFFIATQSGTYQLEVTTTDGCKVLSQTLLLNVSGLNNKNFESTFRIYPNPANDAVWVENTASVAGEIEIADARGQLIASYLIDSNVQKIELSGLASGAYYIRFKSGSETFLKRLMKY